MNIPGLFMAAAGSVWLVTALIEARSRSPFGVVVTLACSAGCFYAARLYFLSN